MESSLRIGTRDSSLALWQANRIKDLLAARGIPATIVPIRSDGDTDLTTPLYAMGVRGIFTRSLDIALLENRIDLAVHSMKDVPVQLPAGLVAAAVPERGNPRDLLVPGPGWRETAGRAIATSSLRRRAQWLHRHPGDFTEPIRGNVNTRLRKLSESAWAGAIFAAAGLERLGLRPSDAVELDWMLPAPAQGALLAVCREQDTRTREALAPLHHAASGLCAAIERDFLAGLLGGCSTPVGALAEVFGDEIRFRGNIFSPDGTRGLEAERRAPLAAAAGLGADAAREILENGGETLQILSDHA